jgi:hypothetical protein
MRALSLKENEIIFWQMTAIKVLEIGRAKTF